MKKTIDYNNEYYLNLFRVMEQGLKDAREQGRPVIFVDEAVFTFNTFNTKAWAGSYDSISVEENKIRVRTQAFIAGVSEEWGLEAYSIHRRSISTPEFVDFIKDLSHAMKGKPFAIFVDNLAVHKTQEAKAAYEKYSVQVIFNVPYSPDFNGIESYFALLKASYKKLLLETIMKGDNIHEAGLIIRSIGKVHDKKII